MRTRAWLWMVVLASAVGASVWLIGSEGAGAPAEGVDRVVLFAPNLNEAAHALGHGDKLVAVTDYCVWPPGLLRLPRIGGMIDPNLERLAALQPQLLVVQGEAVRLRAFAREQGIRIAEVKMDDELESIFSGIEQLDLVLGGDGLAGRRLVAQLRADLEELAASAPNRRPRALLSMGHSPRSLESLSVVGSNSFLGELLVIAGAEHLLADNSQSYFYLSLETLVADPPELVIELRPGEPADAAERGRLRELWQGTVPGVRVEVVDFDGVMIPGPRLVETARAFRSAIGDGRT